MKIYDGLYLGDIAKGERYNILKAIRSKKSRFGTYVITEAHSGSAILDILTLTEFIKNYYDNSTIIGIAEGKQEALVLARQIIDEMYSTTGEFDIYAFCNISRN